MLRSDERNLAYEYISYALGLTDEEVDAIPRHLRKAAVEGRFNVHINQILSRTTI